MTANTAFSVFREKYASDIRFWIVLFFIVRLFGITDPPLEIAHNWRQVTGDMVARNFYEVDANILYPRLDIGGEKTGITGTEFSVLNYLMYLLSLVFGFHDWFGRLINLFVSSIGVLYFYKLLKFKFDERFSFTASFILLTSMWFMFSRKTMPDTFSTSLVIIALYFAFDFFKTSKFQSAIFYFLLVTLGVLSKIPAIYLLMILCFPIFDKDVLLKNKLWISFFTGLMLVPVYWWYFLWVPYLVKEFGFEHYYMGTSFSNGFHEIASNIQPTLEKFYFDVFKFIGFAVFLIGFVLSIIKKEKSILLISGLCSLAFAIFMLKAGRNFYHHSYYIVPFVPIMCLFVAYAIGFVKNKTAYLLLISIIVLESLANQQHDFFLKKSELYKLSLETIADSVSQPTDLIAINGGKNPQLVYFTHRKGWTLELEQLRSETYLSDIVNKGCKYLFLDKHSASIGDVGIKIMYSKVFENEDFIVLSLRK